MGADIKNLQSAGFSDEEIKDWSVKKRKELSEAGFNEEEIGTWLGQAPFNVKPVVDEFNKNLKKVENPEGEEPKPVTSFIESLEAGFQMSVSGLLKREKGPSKVLSEDAPRASRIASSVATLAGDFPFMVGGAGLGMIGGAPTGPGAVVTGFAGAFGLPMGLRKVLMDKYTKGEVTTFSEFWDRLSGAVIETSKGLITGAFTAKAGIAVRGLPAIKAAPSLVQTAASTAAEIPTMVAVGSALEGEVPSSEEFIDAAIVIMAAKGAIGTAGRLRKVYERTGVRPTDVVQD